MNHSGSVRKSKLEKKEFNTNENSSFITVKDKYLGDSHDEREINRIMNSFEKMKSEDPELFDEIMNVNKEILDLCSKPISTREDIKELESHYKDLEEIDEDFLFWCSHKSITKAIIENKNIDLAHFLVVRKAYKLYNRIIHKNIIHEYFKSLSNLGVDEVEDFDKYLAILEFMVRYGKADINEGDDCLNNTPLHFAVLYKQIPFIVFLISQSNVKLNVQNNYKDTPLDFAIESFKRGEDKTFYGEIIKLLIESGAEPATQKDYFETEGNKS